MIEPINSTLRYKEVQERIKKHIIENKLRPGDRLPSENEIASQTGVSRNAVREALKALEALGIVEIRQGSGTQVSAFSLESLLTNFVYSFLFDGEAAEELYAIRKQLELGFIRLAVRNVTDQDIAEMRAIVERMEEKVKMGLSFPDEDMALHHTIFQGINNRSLLKLMDIFRALYSSTPFLQTRTRDEIEEDLRNHIALVDAVAARDAEEAYLRLDKQFRPWKSVGLYRPT